MPGLRPSGLHSTPVLRVVLTGFMGSGKSTVGRLLAEALHWRFVDLDAEVECRTGLSVPDLFARFGEAYFRREEAEALADVLPNTQLVLALGGGAPETIQSRERLRTTIGTAVVHLAGSFEELQARCRAQAASPGAAARPVLADEGLARERFRRRASFYAEIATMTIDTSGMPAQELADWILLQLGFRSNPRETP